ncbi:glycosyltransferase family 39 protein [Patescibacteria group bacterium]|nr:glycosyltransferase family 39 protein [Patescibacteria group bacterium]MBU1970284.1 glycosyltransferase family 39 protein [Patescibacteria group bacterium]
MFLYALSIILASRTLLTNVNAAEWGDSYRILRASNFIREASYPQDEKRPPLFSALLAIRPGNVDAVLWGRIFMLGIFLTALFVFYQLGQKMLTTANQRWLALLFLALNPVYLYWSLRIYADILFSLWVLWCFYLFERWRENRNKAAAKFLIGMGVICGLSILTRFEGYLLTFSTACGILVLTNATLKQKFSQLISFGLTVAILILPWLIYRNPLTSSYFEEPAGRNYDLETIITYLISYLFVLGIIPAFALIRARTAIIKKYPHIFTFLILESLLILAWPAAIPRLFIPIIPFLIVALVKNLEPDLRNVSPVLSIVLAVIYILGQNKLRLQFLGPHTLVFAFVSIISITGTIFLLLRQRKLFLLSALVSMSALASSTIYLHKDVYRTIQELAVYARQAAPGKTLHNDSAGLVSWYLPQSEYKNFDSKIHLTREYLLDNNISYLIITNEFNPNLEIALDKRPHLHLIKKSEYQRGGKMFFTWLVEVE